MPKKHHGHNFSYLDPKISLLEIFRLKNIGLTSQYVHFPSAPPPPRISFMQKSPSIQKGSILKQAAEKRSGTETYETDTHSENGKHRRGWTGIAITVHFMKTVDVVSSQRKSKRNARSQNGRGGKEE